ncbi:MAG: putative sugar nucleotidyl transferase [Candidatus Margulisiibacteriota bacterium]
MYNLCIFEDTKYRNFLPLTYLRPVYDLMCGLDTILGKIIRIVPHENVILHSRDYLCDILKQNHINALINRFTTAGSCLFINGRCLFNQNLLPQVELKEGRNYLYLNEQEEVVMAYLNGENLVTMKDFLTRGPVNLAEIYQTFRLKATVKKIKVTMVNYPWDLINYHQSQLQDDFDLIPKGILKGEIHPQTTIMNEGNIFIDKGAKIDAFSILDATDGPIYISKDVHVHPYSYLKGPLFLGDNTHILGAKVSASSIGPFCKIGGEVTSTTILGYTNKAHDGFLGNSYLGEWINLGAGTTNSNLKNNYKPINVVIDGSSVATNESFFGCIIADHTKAGIGTLLNSSIVIGVGNNIFGGGFLSQKVIPSFVWGTQQQMVEHQIDKMLETADAVMKRRSIDLTDVHKKTIKDIYELTKNDRFHFIKAYC